MKASEEVAKLNGKEGSLTDLAKQYLDIKKANYTVIKAEPGSNVARPKGVDPFVEPGSIMIEKNGKKVILEELTKVCGVSGRYHDSDSKVKVHSILNRAQRVVFKTYNDQKDLRILTDSEIKDPAFGLYLGGGELVVDMQDVLKEPTKLPESHETFQIDCKCEGQLKCKGYVWQW